MKTALTEEALGKAPIGRLLWKLAIPTILAQFINMLYNLVDRIYIGHIAETGVTQLTALGVCTSLIISVSAFAYLVGSGGGPLSSIAAGKGKKEEAERIEGNSFILLIILGVILTTLLLIFSKPLLLAFGGSNETIGYANDYMQIYAIGTIFVMLTLGMNLFITAQGKTMTGMLSVLIGAMLNIALDPLFIFTFNMGVKGAAWATIISQGASCIWVVAFLFSKRSEWQLKPCNFRLDLHLDSGIFALGSATFLMQISEGILTICFNTSLRKYGGDLAVGTMTILFSLTQLAFLPLSGLGQGAQPIISYNYGANNKERVEATFKLLLIVSLSFSAVFCSLILGFPEAFARIFTNDATLLSHITVPARIYVACLTIFGIQIACQQTFTAIGDAVSSLMAAIMRKFILLIPLIYICPAIWTSNQEYAVYLAEPIADFLAVSFTSVLFFFKFRGAMKKMDEKKENEPTSVTTVQ